MRTAVLKDDAGENWQAEMDLGVVEEYDERAKTPFFMAITSKDAGEFARLPNAYALLYAACKKGADANRLTFEDFKLKFRNPRVILGGLATLFTLIPDTFPEEVEAGQESAEVRPTDGETSQNSQEPQE